MLNSLKLGFGLDLGRRPWPPEPSNIAWPQLHPKRGHTKRAILQAAPRRGERLRIWAM
jgi:hypothetical protein